MSKPKYKIGDKFLQVSNRTIETILSINQDNARIGLELEFFESIYLKQSWDSFESFDHRIKNGYIIKFSQIAKTLYL